CEVACTDCKSKTQTLFLILKAEEKKTAMKWSIVSAHADFLGYAEEPGDSIPLRDSARLFLHPMSHALDFMNIDEPFNRKNNFQDYVYDGPRTAQLDSLIAKTGKAEIKFIQLKTISYHFLQLKGWIM